MTHQPDLEAELAHARLLLEAELDGVRFDRPSELILRRGIRLKARRRRLPALSIAAVVAAGSFVLTSPSRGPIVRSTAAGSWTATVQDTDPATTAVVDLACRQSPGAHDAFGGLPLRLLDRRGDIAVAVYTDGNTAGTCVRFRGRPGVGEWSQGGTTGPAPATGRGRAHPVSIEASQENTLASVGGVDAAYGWTAPAVTRVVVTSDKYSTTARQAGDLFLAWWPAPSDRGATSGVPQVSASAYDRTGTVIGVARQ